MNQVSDNLNNFDQETQENSKNIEKEIEKYYKEKDFLDQCHFEYNGHKNLYMIGLGEKQRLTLYNQQFRALNLIYCLDRHHNELCKNPYQKIEKIAIIGGGLSGVTAAAAAAVLGIEVDLFEQRPVLCHLQGSCETRWVHPHIYDWPIPGSDNPYSGLPLLPWRAGKAASVIDKIINKFLRNFVEFGSKKAPKITLYLGASTKLLEYNEELQVFWDNALISKTDNKRLQPKSRNGNKSYDAIILAVGFGVERNVENGFTKSYWRDDSINQPKPGVTSEKPTSFFISGMGDGGLIDLLRVRFHNFNQSSIIKELIESDEIDDYWLISFLKIKYSQFIRSKEWPEEGQNLLKQYCEYIETSQDENLLNNDNIIEKISQKEDASTETSKKSCRETIDELQKEWLQNLRQELIKQKDSLIQRLREIPEAWKKENNSSISTWLFDEYDKIQENNKDFLDYLDYKITIRLRDDTTVILNRRQPNFALALQLDEASLFNTFIVYRLYSISI